MYINIYIAYIYIIAKLGTKCQNLDTVMGETSKLFW